MPTTARKRPANVFSLLLQRETRAGTVGRQHQRAGTTSPQSEQQQWLEEDFLKCCSAQYCELSANSRSTIAAAFSHDGSLLASTHGDHTVKIICTFTGKCDKVLKGHKRTPWVVRFHPAKAHLLASGSLDNEVRIWDVRTGACLDSYDFTRPIASLAFSCDGNQLAVAAGHKLFIWPYTADPNRAATDPEAAHPHPVAILKTRRSLRAVQFHSLGAGLILTAELHEANLLTDPLPTPTIDLQPPHRARPPAHPAAQDAPCAPHAPPSTSGALAAPLPQYCHQYQQTGTASTSLAHPGSETTHSPRNAVATPVGGMRWGDQSKPYRHDLLPSLPEEAGSSHIEASEAEAGSRLPYASSSEGPAPAPATSGIGTSTTLRSALSHGLGTQRQPPSGTPPASTAAAAVAPAQELENLTLTPTLATPPAQATSTPLPLPATPAHQRGISDPVSPSPASSPSPPLPIRPPYAIRAGEPAVAHPRQPSRPTTIPPAHRQTTDSGLHPSTTAVPSTTTTTATTAVPASFPHAPLPSLYRPWFTSSPTQSAHLHRPAVRHAHQDAVHMVQISSSPHNLHSSWVASSSPPVQAPSPYIHIPSRYHPMNPSNPHNPAAGPHPHPQPHQPSPSSPALTPPQPPRPHPQPDLTRLHPPPLHPHPRPGAPPYPPAAPYHLSSSLPLAHPLIPLGCDFPWPWEVQSSPPDPPHPHHASASPPSTPPAATLMLQQDQPSISKLRLFHLHPAAPRRLTDPPLLSISHAVLCSEMGAHLSPCGRYLAAVVACSASPHPTRRAPRTPAHPDPPLIRNILYELRVYSLAAPTFGAVIRSRPIKAAQCLTSLQFSPTSSHLLLAYGRRHLSLCSLVADGHSVTPVHTVLDIYRLSDMALVRVLPSAEDEVNVAAFHPVPGEGVVYGTKEGRLRILRHDRAPPAAPRGGGAGGPKRMGLELEEEEGAYGGSSSEEEEEEEGGGAGGRGRGRGAAGVGDSDLEDEQLGGGADLLWGF